MKKYFKYFAIIFMITLLTGCFDKGKEEPTNPESNASNSNTTSDVMSNSNSSITSNIVSNSNVVSNPNITSNSNVVSNTSNNIPSNSGVKKLNCSTTMNSNNGVKITQINDVTFQGDKVTSMIIYMDIELPSNLASASATYFNTLKNQYNTQYGKYQGVTISANQTSSTKGRITISMDFTKLSSTDKIAMGMGGSENYEVNKAAFERQGYVCK